MKIISVRLSERSYPIIIGAPLSQLGSSVKKYVSRAGRGPKCALIITNPFLKKHFGNTIHASLSRAGIESAFALISEGERSKNLKTVEKLYAECVRQKLDRTSCIVALGGGVVGDIAGFAAATYLRGIALIHVPTTLLAMVDSSIGGKTGVDLAQAKNFVGAFFQPRLVWIDPKTLETLPEREFHNGMAEVIKYGVIADRKLFELLDKKIDSMDQKTLTEVIARCAKIKADVVSRDEKETQGLREILNFGHTVGHAVETVTQYRFYKHGEAISIGMSAAGWMAEKSGMWKHAEFERLERLLLRAHLPIRLKKALSIDRLMQVLARDKKMRAGELRFVLPLRIGKVIVKKVPAAQAIQAIRHIII